MARLRKCPACGQLMEATRRLCRPCWAVVPRATKQRIDAARAQHAGGRMSTRDFLEICALAVDDAAQLRNPQLTLL